MSQHINALGCILATANIVLAGWNLYHHVWYLVPVNIMFAVLVAVTTYRAWR